MAAGLGAAHAQGLVHRDVKPANVLLENGIERVKLTDFGVARAIDDVAITMTGQIPGTPSFMSPEQAMGHQVDHRSDLFSLGSVLYTMCTGRPPFRADSAVATLRRVCDDSARPIHQLNPELPHWLSSIVDRLLAKRPVDRFQTAEDVADLLERCLAHVQQPGTIPLPVELAGNFLFHPDPGPEKRSLVRSFAVGLVPLGTGVFVVAVMFAWIIAMVATVPGFRLEGIQNSLLGRIAVIAFALPFVAIPVAFWIRRTLVEWRYAQQTGDWAPGWIIRCLSCGKSKPLSQLGWVRLGAYGRQTKFVPCDTCGKVRAAEIVRASDPAFEILALEKKPPMHFADSDASWLGRVPWAAWIGLVPFIVVYLAAFAEFQHEIEPVLARSATRIALLVGTAYLFLYGSIVAMVQLMNGPSRYHSKPKKWHVALFFGLLWLFTSLFVFKWAG